MVHAKQMKMEFENIASTFTKYFTLQIKYC